MASEIIPPQPAKPAPVPKRWLPWLTLAMSVCTLIYYYLNLRHWNNKDEDEMALALTMLVTTALWAALIITSILNFKDRWRGRTLGAAIQTLKDEHKTQLQYACNEKIRQLSDRITAMSDSMSKRMQASEYPLMLAGQLTLLAEDALWLSDTFSKILQGNTEDSALTLTHPLIDELITFSPSEEPIPWQRVHLISWYRHYSIHKHHVFETSAGFESDVMRSITPAEQGLLDGTSILAMLQQHRSSLLNKAAELAAPYLEAKKAVAAQAAKLLAETETSPTIS
jgi:hypothetical protein